MQPVSTFLKDNNITGDSLDEIVQSVKDNMSYDPDFFAGAVLEDEGSPLDEERFRHYFKFIKERDFKFIYDLYLYSHNKENPDDLRVAAWFAFAHLAD